MGLLRTFVGHLDKNCSLQDASSHDLTFPNAWKKQMEALVVCPRLTSDMFAAPTGQLMPRLGRGIS